MKKIIIIALVLAAVAMLAYRFLINKDEVPQSDPTKPVALKKNSDAFTGSFDTLLSSYYSLKESLVMADTAKANASASALISQAKGLALNELKGDTTGLIAETAKTFTETMASSGQALITASGLDAKRKEFEIISDAMWSLVRTVKYDGSQVYYQFCPMAFNDKGAYWLSNSQEIRNPYFGAKMLTCGSTEDSLNLQQ